jgi:hypothetical protein
MLDVAVLDVAVLDVAVLDGGGVDDCVMAAELLVPRKAGQIRVPNELTALKYGPQGAHIPPHCDGRKPRR